MSEQTKLETLLKTITNSGVMNRGWRDVSDARSKPASISVVDETLQIVGELSNHDDLPEFKPMDRGAARLSWRKHKYTLHVEVLPGGMISYCCLHKVTGALFKGMFPFACHKSMLASLYGWFCEYTTESWSTESWYA